MQNLVRNLGKAFPRLASATEGALNPTADLNAMREQVNLLRLQYWLRKGSTYGEVIAKAKAEARAIYQQLSMDPMGITYRNIGEAGIWAVQIFGVFCIGEMIGRKSVIGYNVGGPNPYHDSVH